jgi:cysteine desulfurase / selenocysteine lyase
MSMSTNITNTSNGNGTANGASRPKSKSGTKKSGNRAGEGARYYPFGAIPLPDPATIERLANEFFLAMPRNLGENGGLADHPPSESEVESAEVQSEEIPVTSFPEGVPTRDVPRVEWSPNAPESFPSTTLGPLTETDLRAIASSLAGATALVPGAAGTTPTPPVPGSPPEFLAERKTSPFADPPTLPPASELFSFPGISGMPASSPTSPPAGIDVGIAPASAATTTAPPGMTPYFVEGGKGTSPGAAPVLPPVNDLFSFPRVPALPNMAGIQTVPNPPAPPASPSAAPPTVADGTAVPSQSHDAKAVTPQVPTFGATERPSAPGAPVQESSAIYSDSEKAAYPGAASFIPSASELFSFPGVPGVQSAPAIPGLHSAATVPSTESDLDKAASLPTVPGSGNLVEPASSYATQKSQPNVATTTAVPSATTSAFEFRPDLVPVELSASKRPLDAKLIRRDFPILEERVHGRPLIWLDNAATTQKPNAVIERIRDFYHHENSNIHRAAHELAARATDAYESAREKTRRFLNASSTREIVFVRGATEGINLVAQSWGRRNVREGDEVVITWLEHHANIVPWQMLCAEKGAKLRVAPVNDRGEIILEEYEKLLGPRTRIVAFSQVSNALGTVTPAHEMVEIAHRYGARVLVDGAQSVSHMPVDVQTLDCDFFVLSGHKVFGPTGIGVVFGKLDVLDSMPPWQGGGNMIADVTFEKTIYQPAPARFEAGTGNIADAVGLGAALDYVDEIGRENIAAYEHDLLNYGTQQLLTVPGLRLIGTAREKAGVMSFVLDEVRSEDVGVALNQEAIAVRSGHHCAQPILRRMGVESTVRPSLAVYNTCEDIDALIAALMRLQAGRGHRNL